MSKKFPKPWFRQVRGVWYVTIDGVQHNLGADKDATFEQYHRLMAERRAIGSESLPSCGAGVNESELVETLAVKFVTWCQKHRSSATAVWYKDRIESFLKHAGEIRMPFHLED